MTGDASGHISRTGLAALEAELRELETEGRRAIAERIKTARDFGDLKENAEYHDAKDAQAHLETKILRLRELRDNAVVVEPGGEGGAVALGVVVSVRDLDSGREARHTIVSAAESDPAARPCADRRARRRRRDVRRAARAAAARGRRDRRGLGARLSAREHAPSGAPGSAIRRHRSRTSSARPAASGPARRSRRRAST
jgi:transcription elongation GreA/GreB family factor